MKNKFHGTEEGPRTGWAQWREKQDRKIQKPRVNAGARAMAKRAGKAAESNEGETKGS